METAQRLVYYSEDDPLMARMFERIFRFHGFAVEIASDGEEAIAKLTQLPASPSVIILDVMMPKRSGFEVLEFIKTQSLFKDVPVVMLSNLAGKEDADRAIQLGARSYLIKSQYQPKEIVEKIKEIIEIDEQGRVGTKETS
jgi:CheY-like chemotaxis protein